MPLSIRTCTLFLVTGLSQLVATGAVAAAAFELQYGDHGREGRGLFLALAAAAGLFVMGLATRRKGAEASAWSLLTLGLVSVGLVVAEVGFGTFAMATLTLAVSLPAGVVALAEFASSNDLHASLLRFLGTVGTALALGCAAYLGCVG
jgi:hypothetical protein